MKANQQFRGNRIEVAVKGYPGISKILHWDEKRQEYVDPRSIRGCNAKTFRAIKRMNVMGRSRKVQAKFYSLDEARAWRNSETKETFKGPASNYTFGDLVNEWEAWSLNQYEESTREQYAKEVRHMRYLFDVPMDNLRVEEVDSWLDYLISPQYPKAKYRASFKREVSTLLTILNWYRENKDSRYQPPVMKYHKKKAVFRKSAIKYDRALTEDQLESVLEHLCTHQKKVYYYLASFQALTGVRIGEACGLMWDDIDLDNKRRLKHPTAYIHQIIWWRHKDRKPVFREGTKTGEPRYVALCPRLVKLLNEWKSTSPSKTFIFHKDGNPLGYPGIQNAFNKAFRAMKLPHRSTHVFRHSMATLFLNQTGNKVAIQSFLGHKSSRMTDNYAKVMIQAQLDALDDFRTGQIKETNTQLPTSNKADVSQLELKNESKIQEPSPSDPQDETTD